MIHPPYPFPKRWKRVYGESRNDDSRRRNNESLRNRRWEDRLHSRTSTNEIGSEIKTENETEEFVPIPLFREGEWVGGEDLEEEENDTVQTQIVLSEEWQKRFKLTAERREKRRVQEMLASSNVKDVDDVSFGISSKHNEDRAMELYGKEASNQVLLLEASLNAQFDRMMDKNNPVLWPEIPIDAIRGWS